MFIGHPDREFIRSVSRRGARLECIFIFTCPGIDPDSTVGRFDLRDRIAVCIDSETVGQFRTVIGI